MFLWWNKHTIGILYIYKFFIRKAVARKTVKTGVTSKMILCDGEKTLGLIYK